MALHLLVRRLDVVERGLSGAANAPMCLPGRHMHVNGTCIGGGGGGVGG